MSNIYLVIDRVGDGTASRSEAYSGNTRRGRERGNVKSSVKKRYIRHDKECSSRLCTFVPLGV